MGLGYTKKNRDIISIGGRFVDVPQARHFREKATIDYLKTTEVWTELKNAINSGNDKEAEAILHNLLKTLNKMKNEYEKVTVEIRKDILKDVKIFCAQNHYTLKAYTNIALEALLHIGMPDED